MIFRHPTRHRRQFRYPYRRRSPGLLWVLLGGAGTILGPLVGTLLMFYLVDISSEYTSAYLIVVGLALIVLVLWFPKGILGTLRDRLVPWLP